MAEWYDIVEHHLSLQGRRLFCWIPVLFGSGSATYFFLKAEPSHALEGLLTALFLGAGFLWWHAPSIRLALCVRVLTGAFMAWCAGLGAAAFQTHHQPAFPALPYESVWISGQVVETAHHDTQTRLVLRNVQFESPWYRRNGPFERRLSVSLKNGERVLPVVGQKICLRVMLHRPLAPFWPGGRDLQREAWFSGVAGSGVALSSPVLLSAPSASSLTGSRERLALRIMAQLPGQGGAVAATVLCGETSALSLQTRQDFAASGLSHLLAVAGLHLGIVMGFFLGLFRRLFACSEWLTLRFPCRSIAFCAAFLVGAFYIALTGFHLPGLRALGMAALVTMAMMIGRHVIALRILGVVALGLEIIQPVIVADVSFQMSFAAVMCLISGLEIFQSTLASLHEKVKKKGGILRFSITCGLMPALVSCLTGLSTLPVSMAHFGLFQPWFLLANMLAVPLMAFWVMPCGLLALLFCPLGWEYPFLQLMGWGITKICWMAHFVAEAPFAHISVPSTPGWGIALYLVGLSVLCLWRGRCCLLGLAPLCLGITSAWLVSRPVLLVAPEYGLVAVQQEGRLLVGPHDDPVISKMWAQDMALSRDSLSKRCGEGFCRLSVEGGVVLLYLQPLKGQSLQGAFSFSPEMCRDVRLFVSIPRMRPLCPSVPMIDRSSVWRDGAWAVYPHSGGGFRLVSDRSFRGVRPWVPYVGFEGEQGLPLAMAE